MANEATQIVDYPVQPQKTWIGYYNKKDPTVLPPNVLTAGTFNCFIPDNDLIVTRRGSQVIGQGAEMVLEYDTLVGNFLLGEVVTGGTSGAVGTIVTNTEVGISQMKVDNVTGDFVVGETLTGTDSGATANIILVITSDKLFIGHRKKFTNAAGVEMELRVWQSGDSLLKDVFEVYYTNTLTNVTKWWQISPSINSVGEAVPRLGMRPHWYFTEWFDTSLDPSVSLNVPRIIGTNGTNQIYSSTMAIGEIVSVVGDNITLAAGLTWTQLGFIDPARDGGSPTIVVNGNSYTVFGGWDTDTLALSSSFGISPGDLAFDFWEADQPTAGSLVYDYCATVKNYVHYGNFQSRNLYGSNAFEAPASQAITTVQAVQNDLIINGAYTGTGTHRIRYQIDGTVTPPQGFFYDPGTNSPNNMEFSGEHTGTSRDVYRVEISDATVGSELYQVYKNNSIVLGPSPISYDNPIAIIDGLFITFIFIDTTVTPYTVGQSWTYIVGGQDTYSWFLDDVLQAAGIGTSVQLVYNGVGMYTNSTSGHSLGDFWVVTISQQITRAWANFYYDITNRKPGQGFNVRLSSNFWTMANQEDYMYVNDAHGKWQYIDFQLSSDLLSETILVQPLKSDAQNKAIWPYMIGYVDNNLMYVTDRKTLDMIGRKKLVELPQIGSLSDPVKYDFLAASFTNGSMEFWDKKVWVTSPQDGIMFCFDWVKKYWQPPQVFPENGILSIIGDTLISHSSIRNQTNSMFIGTNDNGSAFDVVMRFPYNSYGNRWHLKEYNMTFIEGYIQGAPEIQYNVLLDLNGCHGIAKHPVVPIPCIPADRASLGKAPLGEHGLGNDPRTATPYFQEIYKSPAAKFYFAEIELSCSTLDQDWSVLSVGLNAISSRQNNHAITSNSITIP